VSPLRVLLVEDDAAVREGIGLALRHQGHDVFVVASGEQALENTWPPGPDVVILDVMLPGIDGLETCRRLRTMGNFPIIMLTARGDDADIVAGLEAGADDYVVKPVQPRVLEARIQAVLRRFSPAEHTPRSHGDVTIDRTALTVTKRGREIQLTPTEMRLLLVLSESPLQVFSRDQLLRLVWEHDYLGDSRLVDACVQRLRSKIEDVPAEPRYVQTVRGFGYRFGPL
jgi:DNA-binding response OmpR family regulator